MLVTAKSRRDSFTFSLGGMAGINSYAFVPAIPDDRINKALDARFRQQSPVAGPSPLVLKIENLLARFYAGASCEQN
jgi:hypothetical protein